MMVSLTRLRMLAELSRLGTIAATADALGYSASAVSQQIALLEREAGVSLLERGPRSIHLTEAGRRLASRADEMLAAVAAAEREMRRFAGLDEGLVRIAMFPSAAAAIAPALFAAIARSAEGVALHLEDLPPEQALAALRQEQADVAIVYDFPDRRLDEGQDLRLEALGDDPLMVCASARSPVAALPVLAFETAAELSWIADGAPPAEQCFAMRYLASHGVRPKIAARTDDPMVLRALITAGTGVALLPALQMHSRTGLVAVPLAVPPAPRRIMLATRAGAAEASPAVRLVTELVRRLLVGEHHLP